MGVQTKMLFNPDASKQAQEVAFSHKKISLTITISTSVTCRSQKHLGLYLDAKLNRNR